jgi:hypothetical protein
MFNTFRKQITIFGGTVIVLLGIYWTHEEIADRTATPRTWSSGDIQRADRLCVWVGGNSGSFRPGRFESGQLAAADANGKILPVTRTEGPSKMGPLVVISIDARDGTPPIFLSGRVSYFDRPYRLQAEFADGKPEWQHDDAKILEAVSVKIAPDE